MLPDYPARYNPQYLVPLEPIKQPPSVESGCLFPLSLSVIRSTKLVDDRITETLRSDPQN